jgi:hypothetical protein
MPSRPLALTDEQMSQVLRCAEPLAPYDRGAYLERVAEQLRGRELGDGVVHLVCREVQRQFFSPPNLARRLDASKYR